MVSASILFDKTGIKKISRMMVGVKKSNLSYHPFFLMYSLSIYSFFRNLYGYPPFIMVEFIPDSSKMLLISSSLKS